LFESDEDEESDGDAPKRVIESVVEVQSGSVFPAIRFVCKSEKTFGVLQRARFLHTIMTMPGPFGFSFGITAYFFFLN